MPRFGSVDDKPEGCFEVGLLEDSENASGVRHLKLRVQIDLVVDGINEPVEAFARVHVREVSVDHERVVGSQIG